MTINYWYMRLKDTLIYNIHYAPNYPDEDCTSLDKEYDQIKQYYANVQNTIKSDYKKSQLNFAKEKIDDAFLKYSKGMDGRKILEEALEYVESSKRIKPPSTNFIVDSSGNVSINIEKDNNI